MLDLIQDFRFEINCSYCIAQFEIKLFYKNECLRKDIFYSSQNVLYMFAGLAIKFLFNSLSMIILEFTAFIKRKVYEYIFSIFKT